MKVQIFVLLQIVTAAFCDPSDSPSLTTNALDRQTREEDKMQEELQNERESARTVFTTNGAQCVFPFKYEGELYFGCTSLKTPINEKLKWCLTVYEITNYDGKIAPNGTWGFCENSKNLTAPMITYSGQQCDFPFVYKGAWYYGCTTFDHPRHKSWCVVEDPETGGYSKTQEKDLCRDTRNTEVDTYGGTGNGLPCKFPFEYENTKVVHYGCTNDDNSWGRYTCRTVNDGWGYCNVIDTETNLKRLRSEINSIFRESDCVFPFIYDGEEQFGCTGSTPWCATTYNYDTDGEYRYCDKRDILGVASRKKGSANVDSCTFPFLCNGVQFSELVFHGGMPPMYTDRYICPSIYNIDDNETLIPGWKQLKKTVDISKFLEWAPSQLSYGVSTRCPIPWYYENIQNHGCAIGQFKEWCPFNSLSEFDDSSSWYNCATLDG